MPYVSDLALPNDVVARYDNSKALVKGLRDGVAYVNSFLAYFPLDLLLRHVVPACSARRPQSQLGSVVRCAYGLISRKPLTTFAAELESHGEGAVTGGERVRCPRRGETMAARVAAFGRWELGDR